MKFITSILVAKNSLLTGMLNTVTTALLAIVIGTILGILMGFILCYGNKYTKLPFRIYIDIIRGVPGLVTIFTLYYLFGYVLMSIGIELTPKASGIIALSALSSAQMAEVTRGALESISIGQTEAGKSIGLRFKQIFIYILMPQAIVQIIPPWINTATEMVKGSTLLALIGVSELLLTAHQLVATTGKALPYYMFIGLIFFMLNTVIQYFGAFLEKKLDYYKR